LPHEVAYSGETLAFEKERLTAAEFLFRTLQVVDVGEQHVPTEDPSVRITKRHPASLEPSIDAIEATKTYRDVVWIAC